MKKFLLLAACTVALGASATGLKVGYSTSYNGDATQFTAIADGADICISAVEDIDEGRQYEMPMYLQITNGTTPATVRATLVQNDSETTMTAPDGIQFCIFGTCHGLEGADVQRSFMPGEVSSGVGEHISYLLGTGASTVNLDDAAYQGQWVGTLTVTDGSETITCTVRFSPTGAGIEGVRTDANAPEEYFDLQGRPVANPDASGIYIRRSGGTVTKVIK